MRLFFFTFYSLVLAGILLCPPSSSAPSRAHLSDCTPAPLRLSSAFPEYAAAHQPAESRQQLAPRSGTARQSSAARPIANTDPLLINQYGQRLRLFEDLLNQHFVCIGLLTADPHPDNTAVINALQRLRYALAEAAFPNETVICCVADDAADHSQLSLLQCADRHGICSAAELPEFHLCHGFEAEIHVIRNMLQADEVHPQARRSAPLLLLGDERSNQWCLFPATTPPNQLLKYFQQHRTARSEPLLTATQF